MPFQTIAAQIQSFINTAQIRIYSRIHDSAGKTDWPARRYAFLSSQHITVWQYLTNLPVEDSHTKSELNTGTQPVQDGTASRDEYTQAQKLGMGQVNEGKGKAEHILQSKLLK